MYPFKKIIASIILFSLPFSDALAYPEFDKNITDKNGTLSVSGPADRSSYGEIVYNSGGNNAQLICNSSSVNYNLARIETVPVATWTGRTYQATPSHTPVSLFESGVSGFSLSPLIGITNSGKFPLSLQSDITTLWTGYTSNADRISKGFRVTSMFYVYKDETRFVGATQIPGQTMFKFLCQDSNGLTQEAYNFKMTPMTISGTVTGCTPDSSAAIIEMDKIAQSTIEAADSSTLMGTKKFTASLQCDPNILVYVSLIDLSDKSNVTNVASLTADSTAKGVGFAVTDPSGKLLRFGPDGSATGVPGQVKYFIQQAASASSSRNNRVSTQFGFSYVRKVDETIKSGSAKAVIGLTYSYQ